MNPALRLAAALLCSLVLAAGEANDAKTQTSSLEFGTLVWPVSLKANEVATFTLTLNKVPDTAKKVHCDLHWIDAAGTNRGILVGGTAKDIVAGKPIVWDTRVPAKEGIAKALVIVYLSTDGSWKGMVAKPPKLAALEVKP